MAAAVPVPVEFELISPFPVSAIPLLWEWSNEFPDCNFDDFGLRDKDHFVMEMTQRRWHERTWGVTRGGDLVGFVAYLPVTRDTGTLHGVCFTKAVHGTGVAKASVRQIIKDLFHSGIRKISAGFFATTPRIGGLLRHAGFEREGVLKGHTRQHGKPMDMIVMSVFAERNGN